MFLISAIKNRRAIENGQSIETGNTWHTRHVTNTNKNKTEHRKKMSTMDPTKKTALNPDTCEKLAVPTSYTVTNIDKSGKQSVIEEIIKST